MTHQPHAQHDGHPPVSSQFEAAVDKMLLRRWQEGRDRHARDALFERCYPLARKLARRYVSANEPLEDLVQVASVGLLGAADRFDLNRDTSFRAYAIPTILGELKRHFRNTSWSAHVPRGAQELALQVERAARHLTEETGRSPDAQQVARYLEISVEDVLTGLQAASAHFSLSLDASTSDRETDETATLADRVGTDDDGYGLSETKLSFVAATRRLPHLEREALRLRTERGLKQSEIAVHLGCSQMQVSRLLSRANDRLVALMDPSTPSPSASRRVHSDAAA
jgi:RNA polymerase sigma-B factor